MISKILNRQEIKDNPPVLVDIGASGKLHEPWKLIAKYSICIAFDADKRDFDYIIDESGNFKKLYIFSCIVSEYDSDASDFYLTKSPHCSSMLKPDLESLKEWAYSDFFEIENTTKIKTKSLKSVLTDLRIKNIDWFKTDSQGIDLRLFKSLGDDIIHKVMVAEFEPGILNSYIEEDKLYEIVSFMDQTKNFWLSDFILKGSQRIRSERFNEIFKGKFIRKLAMHSLKKSPGWAELIYINTFKKYGTFNERDFLLGWVFATIYKQHGFALFIAEKGFEISNKDIFLEMRKHSLFKLKTGLLSIQLIKSIFTKLRNIFSS